MRRVLYLFGKFSDQDIDWLSDAGSGEQILKGAELVTEGESAERLFLTLSGSFLVSCNGVPINDIGPGEIVGDLEFLDMRPFAATVTALEEGFVVSYSMNRLRTRLRLDTGFASRFYYALALEMADRTRRNLLTYAMEQREQKAEGETGFQTDENGHSAQSSPNELPSTVLDDMNLAATRFDKMRRAFLKD